ncbi:MAG: RidA family protein [Parasphingorhabdus sp.]|uniref:RidA family protein n=1 Tax=Parasphingorhabdus sp. TaxID=2709688 RepID=UPI00329A6FC8
MPDIERINPKDLPDAGAMGYAQVTTCAPGKMVFVSGQVAWAPGGDPAPDNLAEQAKIASSNLGKALASAGAGPQNIVSARAFIVDYTEEKGAEAFPEILAFLDGNQVAFTLIGCAALASPDLMIEIEAIAIV